MEIPQTPTEEPQTSPFRDPTPLSSRRQTPQLTPLLTKPCYKELTFDGQQEALLENPRDINTKLLEVSEPQATTGLTSPSSPSQIPHLTPLHKELTFDEQLETLLESPLDINFFKPLRRIENLILLLPPEIHYEIIRFLDDDDKESFSRCSRWCYFLAFSLRFEGVVLSKYEGGVGVGEFGEGGGWSR